METASVPASRKRLTPEGGDLPDEPPAKATRVATDTSPATNIEPAHADNRLAHEAHGNQPADEPPAQAGPQVLPNQELAGSTSAGADNMGLMAGGDAAAAQNIQQQDLAGALQQTLTSTLNAASQQDAPTDAANLTLLLQLAHSGQGTAAHTASGQPASPGAPGSKDDGAPAQQAQQDSLLSQLQLLLQLQQQLQQQPRQAQPGGQHHPGGQFGDGGQEASDNTLSDMGALLQQQLEHASKEHHPDGTPKAPQELLPQAPDLQRVPPPLQLELPTQPPSSSAPPPSTAPQPAPGASVSPTQQLVQMLLALQSPQPAPGSAPATDMHATQQQHPAASGQAAAGAGSAEAAASSAAEGGDAGSEQHLGDGAPDAAAQKAKSRLGALPAFASEAQLLQLLDRVGLQHPLDTRALLQAAGLQPAGTAAQPQPASTGLPAGGPSDDHTHMAVATLASLSSTGQQAAAALAAASAVAADAAAVAAAGPAAQASLPPVSPLARVHQAGTLPKQTRTHKQGGKGGRGSGEEEDEAGSGSANEDAAPATEELPPQGSPPAQGVPVAEPAYLAGPADLPAPGVPVTSAAAAPVHMMPGTSMLLSGLPSSSAAAHHPTASGLAAGGVDPSVMAAALDQSVLPLLQQIAPFGVQQLTQEQREQAERMLLSLLPLLPLTPSDGSQGELDPESAAVVAAAAAAAHSDPGHRLVPTAGGAPMYGMYDPRAGQLQMQHEMQGPGAGALSTVVAGRGRKDQGPKRLLDFRLHVPHKFVESHFPDQAFPLHTTADVYVNSDLVKEAAAVKLYATRNNTRKTGIGNFWLTGLQQTIKLYKDVKVNSISVADNGEGQVKKFVLHLSAQGVWHEPPAFVKRGLGQTGDTTGNPAVKPYDGRIHVPLALMKQHFAGVEAFPLMATADMYMNGELMVEGTPVRIVRYQKHKREGHYNYWITGHQKLVRQCNDLRVLCVEFLPEGRFKICFVAPQ